MSLLKTPHRQNLMLNRPKTCLDSHQGKHARSQEAWLSKRPQRLTKSSLLSHDPNPKPRKNQLRFLRKNQFLWRRSPTPNLPWEISRRTLRRKHRRSQAKHPSKCKARPRLHLARSSRMRWIRLIQRNPREVSQRSRNLLDSASSISMIRCQRRNLPRNRSIW